MLHFRRGAYRRQIFDLTNAISITKISEECWFQLAEKICTAPNGALKIDLHTHTAEDPEEEIGHTGCELIDRAHQLGFDAISITNHNAISANGYLHDYARERGIILIPGVELKVSGKHVLAVNVQEDILDARTFDDLRRLRTPECMIVAPHPFFPGSSSLLWKMREHIDVFDAIEFSWFYHSHINFNVFAARAAASHGLPLLSTSDCHRLDRFGQVYSLVTADKDAGAIVEAVRTGRVEIVANPLNLWELSAYGVEHVVSVTSGAIKRLLAGDVG
jgi:predicted metal-dependent phosphoesterase TrpH